MKTRPRLLERAFWNLHSRNWDDLLQHPESARHVSDVAGRLPSITPAGALVADLGCGTGNHAHAMAQAGLRVVAVDFTAAMLERCAAKRTASTGTIQLLRADLNVAFPFASASLDGVLSVYSIQFLDAAAFLAEVHRVLRPGAVAVIEAPRHDPTPRDTSGLPRRYRAFRVFKNFAATVGGRVGLVRSFSEAELTDAARTAHFEVTDLRITQHSIIVQLGRR